MQMIPTNDISTNALIDGPDDGQAVVFVNSLGTDLRVWDAVLPLLPGDLRILRYDMRGHGRSDAPPAPYHMGTLVADLAALLDTLKVRRAVVVGLSIGGIVAQGLAAERPDLVRALVLADTAAKIGTPELWQTRIDAVRKGGLEAIAGDVMARWFSPRFRRDQPEACALWQARLTDTPAEGYMGCCAAIAETDLMESTSRLRLPALVICGAMDGATPPDLVRETAALIPGADFRLIPGAGHLPCIEAPDLVATLIGGFLDTLPEGT
ncbi:3-oxoadipate enol-lactonase [Oceanibium sediminis]|uniref:3-oxoadipate enol-lactonase n=1 Tax=Oceanibium sediminis TaxID=2026339 RepID=UPI00351A3D81